MFNKLRNVIDNATEKAEQNSKTMRALHIFAIYDTKSKDFHTPFFQNTPQNAIRAFKTEVNRQDAGNMLYLYPDEYELHYLGEFDQITGELRPASEKLMNGNAVTTKKGE